LRGTGLKDPEWFQLLRDLPEDVVLVTYDNNMPLEHGSELSASGIALAVIDKAGRPLDMSEEEYWREIIHRHAHRFINQQPGSLWKYRRRGRRRITLKS
jgi:LmbE family N-acetylglucosaminyl deacetylase